MWAKDIHRDWSSGCPNPKSRANFPNFHLSLCILIPSVNSYGCGEAPGVIAICSKWCVAGGSHRSMCKVLQGSRSARVPALGAGGRPQGRSSSIPTLPRARTLPRATSPWTPKLLVGEQGGAEPEYQHPWLCPLASLASCGAGLQPVPPGRHPTAGLRPRAAVEQLWGTPKCNGYIA